MKEILKDIAEIKSGHPFRGAIKEFRNGNGYVIQTRDQTADGQIEWMQLVKTEVLGRKEPEWLQAGEIIFAARGHRNLASVIKRNDVECLKLPVVCSPHYFQLRINQSAEIMPEFLTWQLNQVTAQRYFQQSAEGSAQVSIRRTVLENTPIVVPTMQKQHMIIALNDQANKEKQIYQRLIALRQTELNAIAKQTLKNTQ